MYGYDLNGAPHTPETALMQAGIEHRQKDDKGRFNIDEMTQEEMVRESLVIARATQDLVEKFLTDFTSGKIGGPMGMLGKFLK